MTNNEKKVIIHYSELGLKKRNRKFFEHHLKNNIQQALADLSLPADSLKIDFGRFILNLPENAPLATINARLREIIGIAHFNIAFNGNPDVHLLKEQILKKLEQEDFNTFCIDTRRADKQFPFTSVEVNQIVGEHIHRALNKSVQLKDPDLRCIIEIYNQKVFFSYQRMPGLRGLPVRSSGKVVSLLSAGIDSPVASFRMMTRGCQVVPVHFHSFPFTDKRSYYNAIELTRQLTRFQYQTRLYLVPLVRLQEAIIAHAPAKWRLLLYRRMMFRIAERIALKEKAKALITGESLGQVASQTLENIAAVSAVATLPVLRPLIGLDKETIIQQAKTIGTFRTSTEPFDDCCSLLVPPNPETKASASTLENTENNIENWTALLEEALEKTEVKKFHFP